MSMSIRSINSANSRPSFKGGIIARSSRMYDTHGNMVIGSGTQDLEHLAAEASHKVKGWVCLIFKKRSNENIANQYFTGNNRLLTHIFDSYSKKVTMDDLLGFAKKFLV